VRRPPRLETRVGGVASPRNKGRGRGRLQVAGAPADAPSRREEVTGQPSRFDERQLTLTVRRWVDESRGAFAMVAILRSKVLVEAVCVLGSALLGV
jgi:hypothetical protein